MQSTVRVVVRVRPTDEFVEDALQVDNQSKAISITLQPSRSRTLVGKPPSQLYQFSFDSILQSASQEEVFEACAGDVLKGALSGYNGTILCFGQTGAGKTFTMSGGRQSYRQRGLLPRMLSALFSELDAAPGVGAFKLTISYLEIYNETMFDLLDLTTAPHELSVYEDARGRAQVEGLKRVEVTTEAQALALFFEGERNRVIGEHQLNRQSSRSHAIFTVLVEVTPRGEPADGRRVQSKLTLVDLAGSERVSKTRSEGVVLREAGHINKSLHMLEQVVLAVNERGREHVPYRSSKLTHVLKDALGGNCRTVLVANLWGAKGQLEESLSTCRFAARMAQVQCDVSPNIVQDSGARVKQLEREVADLKVELAIAVGENSSSDQPLSNAQRAQLRQLVGSWLLQPAADMADPLAPLQLTSMRLVRETLLTAKALYGEGHPPHTQHTQQPLPPQQQWPPQQQQAGSMALHSFPGGGPAMCGAPMPVGAGMPCPAGPRVVLAMVQRSGLEQAWHEAEAVGELDDDGQSGGVGVAPEGARPGLDPSASGLSHGDGEHPCAAAAAVCAQEVASSSAAWAQPSSPAGPFMQHESGAAAAAPGSRGCSPDPSIDVTALLEQFRAGPGQQAALLVNENHAKMRGARWRAKELALALNELKRRIDEAKARCQELGAARQGLGGELEASEMGTDEYGELMRLRQLKASYRDAHGELQAMRSEAEYNAGLVAACTRELNEAFQGWCMETYGERGARVAAGQLVAADASTASSLPVSGLTTPAASSAASRRGSVGSSGGDARMPSRPHMRGRSTPSQRRLPCGVGTLLPPGGEEDGDPLGNPQAAAYWAAQAAAARASPVGGTFKKHACAWEREPFSM